MSSVVFQHDNTALYLAPAPQSKEDVIWHVDAASPTGNYAITQVASLVGGGDVEASLSLKEKLRRERLRQFSTGITSFSVGAINTPLFNQHGNLFASRMTDTAGAGTAASPCLLIDKMTVASTTGADAGEPILDARPSPDGNWVAFVHDSELHVARIQLDTPLSTASEIYQLTHSARGSSLRCNGLAEYIAEEELDRHEGFWWSPCGNYLVYQHTDETLVEEFSMDARVPCGTPLPVPSQGESLASWTSKIPTTHYCEKWRYPFAGSRNATIQLYLLDLRAVFSAACAGDRAAAAASLFSNAELHIPINLGTSDDFYLLQLSWLPAHAGTAFTARVLNRAQTVLDLVLYTIVPGSSLAGELIVRELTVNGWLNGSDCFRWLPSSTHDGGLALIWPSEQTGFRHLYKFDMAHLRSEGAKSYCGPCAAADGMEVVPCDASAPFSTIYQSSTAARYVNCVTAGEYVVDKVVGTCDDLIFFQAIGADQTTPTELHLCCASLTTGSSGGIIRVTSGAGTHKATMSADCSVMSIELSSLYTKESSLSFYTLKTDAIKAALVRARHSGAPKQSSPAISSSLGAAVVDFAQSGLFIDETSSSPFVAAAGVAHGLVPLTNAAERVFARQQRLISGFLSGSALHVIAEIMDEQRAEAAAVPSRLPLEPLRLRHHSACADAVSLDALQIPIIIQIAAADGATPMYGAVTLPFEAAPSYHPLPTVV